MDLRLFRAYLVELLGTFAFVFVAGGIGCVNVATSVSEVPAPAAKTAAPESAPVAGPLTVNQPGLVGVALGQALIWLAMASWTAPISGGFLNPAVTIMRWVFGQISSPRMAWFVGAQVVGGVLAGLALKGFFEPAILSAGGSCLNPQVFPPDNPQGRIWTGLAIELVLTFFFVLAMFARVEKTAASWVTASALSAAVLAAAVLFAGPITGAALNPARWFGPAFWQMLAGSADAIATRQALAYVAGPIVGALLAGAFVNRVYEPALKDASWDGSPTRPGA